MGLDIYKYRVVSQPTDIKFILDQDEDNRNTIELFEHFKELQQIEVIEYLDMDATFEKLGLNYDDYEYTSTTFNDDDVVYCFEYNPSKERMQILQKDCVVIHEERPVIYAEKGYGYQRRGMGDGFYKFHYGCEYGSDDEDSKDYIYFAFTNDVLDEAKNCAEPESPIINWALEKDEFVYFSN